MISVVIPVRNRANIVGRTLDSIAAQTLAPDEVILVDNGSTDGTVDVLRRYPEAIVLEEPRPGAAIARNTGLARVRSSYVLFFDSDDFMPPRHIEEVAAELRANGRPDIGAFNMELVGLDGSRSPKPFRRGDPMKMQIFHSILSTQRCVINTDFIRRVGGWNESLRVWDDLELGVRLLASGADVSHLKISEPIIVYAQANSITGTDFHSKAGQWERALDACAAAVNGTRYARMIDYRRAILAGHYRREGHPELARGLTNSPWMNLIARYVAAGGRGVAHFAF